MNEIIKTALNRNDTQFVMIFHSFFIWTCCLIVHERIRFTNIIIERLFYCMGTNKVLLLLQLLGYGATTDGHTIFVNCSICDTHYKPVNSPVVFDLPNC